MSPITLGHRGSVESGPLGGEIWAHKPTGIAGVDGPMLDEARDDLPDGGILRLHNGGDTPYMRDTTWTWRKLGTIRGCGIQGKYGPLAAVGSIDGPQESDPLRGSFIRKTTLGKIIDCPASAAVPNFQDMGVMWDPSIAFGATGNGFEATADTNHFGLPDVGIIGGLWWNLMVYGGGGNYDAYRWTNCMNSRLGFFRWYGGGGLGVIGNSGVGGWNYGCCTFTQPWGQLFCNGSQDGIYTWQNRAAAMNQLVFERPLVLGVSHGALTPPTTAQYMFHAGRGPGGDCSYSIVGWKDFESPSLALPVYYGTHVRSYVEPGGISGASSDAASRRHRIASAYDATSLGLHFDQDFIRRGLSSSVPAFAPGAAAGSTGTVSGGVVSDDYSGILTVIPSGTGIAFALGSQIATMTPGTAANIKAYHFAPIGTAAATAGRLFSISSGADFLIRFEGNGSAFASGSTHQWSYVATTK